MRQGFQDWVPLSFSWSVSPAAHAGPGPDAEKAVPSASHGCSCLTPTRVRTIHPEPRVMTGFVQLCAGGAITLVLLGATRGLGVWERVVWVGPGARGQGGAAKLILASGTLSVPLTQAAPGLRKQSSSSGGPPGGTRVPFSAGGIRSSNRPHCP